MSFLFCLLLGELLRPLISRRLNFDNFDRFAYFLGFWLPLIPLIFRYLPGGLFRIYHYPFIFDFPIWAIIFFVIGIFYRIYTRSFRESLFCFLPIFGLFLNFTAEYFSAESFYPIVVFNNYVARLALFPGYWIPICFLILCKTLPSFFRFSLRKRWVLGPIFLFFAFSLFEFAKSYQDLQSSYPQMEIVSFKPTRIEGGSFSYVGKENDSYFFGETHRLQKSVRQVDENRELNEKLIQLFSIDPRMDFFFRNLFVHARFQFDINFKQTSIFIRETAEVFRFQSLDRLEIFANKYSILKLVQCDQFLFGIFKTPCYQSSFR